MADHREGGEGEEVKVVDVATLRKRATELGAPAGVPDAALSRWNHFCLAPPPRLERTSTGYVVAKPEKKETQIDTYGGLFHPIWEDCKFNPQGDHTARGKVQEGPGR